MTGRLARILRALAVDADLLRRRRELRLLVFGQSTSLLGSMITLVAIPVQVYDLTGSTVAVGLLGVAEFVPILALALVGGALADAFDRRRLVMLAEVGAIVIVAGLVVNAALEQVWFLYVAAALIAAFSAIRRPPLDAMLPRLVEREELKAASALNWGVANVAQLAGPALAGVLIAWVGFGATYAVDLATFVVSLAALAAMRTPPPTERQPVGVKAIAEGLRYAASRQELLGTYLIDMVAMFFAMPMALFPALAESYGGGAVVGLLYAAPSAGAVLFLAVSGWTARVHHHGRAVVLAACGWGVAIAAFGLAQSLPLALACLAVAGGRRRDLRRLPRDDLERDDPRPAARPPGRRGDDLVVVGAAARQRGGGADGGAGGGARVGRGGRRAVRGGLRRPDRGAAAAVVLRLPPRR